MVNQTITQLPTPPSTTDVVNFNDRADNFLAAIPTFVTQTNTVIGQINSTETNINSKESSATSAASTATTQAGIATTKASEASASATAAYNAQLAAEAVFDNFDDKYLGAKATAPTVDNDGNPLVTGALFFKTTSPKGIYVYDAELAIWSSPTYVPTSHGSLSGRSDADSHPISAITGLSTALNGFKNYIINGNFDVWQYGTSQTSIVDGYGSDDRWWNKYLGSTRTHSQVVCTDVERALFNANYFSRTVVTSVVGSGNFVVKRQAIENVTRLAGKTVTVSFWAKADSNKNIAIEVAQNFGTGGTPSASVEGIGSQLVSLTTTWQKKTVTVNIPSIVGKTLGTDGIHTTMTNLFFWFDAGSSVASRTANLGQQSGTFDIAQVQLEEGSVATPFENRLYGLELSLCQRYYEVGRCIQQLGIGTTIGVALTGQVFFKTSKRIVPTVTYLDFSGAQNKVTLLNNSGAETNGVSVIAGNQTNNDMRLTASTTNTTQNGIVFTYTASAEL